MDQNTKTPVWARLGWMIGKRIILYAVVGPILGEVLSAVGDVAHAAGSLTDSIDS